MKLYMNQWLEANGRRRQHPEDEWYLTFARKLLPIVQQSVLFSSEAVKTQVKATLQLTMYLQDAVAQAGGWTDFTGRYRELYGKPLPFYPTSADYVPDEINPEDVSFLLWQLKSHPATEERAHIYTFQNPFAPELSALSTEVYRWMDAAFEEAPISRTASASNWMRMPGLYQTATPLPETTKGNRLSTNAARCLAHSGGEPLLYFATYRELRNFFIEVLKWEDRPSDLLPELANEQEFVIYANVKGMLLASGVAAYFREKRNPLFSPTRAAEEGYRMFCQPGTCPFDLLKYGMKKQLLPDVALPFSGGKELLQREWDFIARYYLAEYYEGE